MEGARGKTIGIVMVGGDLKLREVEKEAIFGTACLAAATDRRIKSWHTNIAKVVKTNGTVGKATALNRNSMRNELWKTC